MTTAPQRSFQRRGRNLIAALFAAPLLFVAPSLGEDNEAIGFEKTPPRLSLVEGEASFWRPGADEWTRAQINTPLAAGDELYTDEAGKLEIQIGSRAFARAAGQTQLSLYALEPDYLQLRLSQGDLALDLRALKAGQTVEVSTPNAAFTVEAAGYYRVTATENQSVFISRRGGRALATPVTGSSVAVGASEQIVITGTEAPTVATYAAPEIDSWDRWNYARTDRQIESVSSRYVSQDVYGLSELDEYGDWRQDSTYGAVWVPRHVVADWSPYSYGRWIYDPFYGWSWIDYAPWGWAPFHYGRWVHISGRWGWCPGPVVVRPYYAPALVAFYGSPGVSVSVSFGVPFGWVALGWGEPIAPWWGPSHFRSYAYWAGWGGPYIVNNVHIHNKVIHVDHIKHHEHWRHRRGSVIVDRDHFGRRGVDPGRRWRDGGVDRLQPVRGELPFRPRRESLRAGDRAGRRPPREVLDRRVVSTREPRISRVAVDSDASQRGNRRRGDERDVASRVSPRIVRPTREQPVREARRGEAATLESNATRSRRREAPLVRGGGSDNARREESRAGRYQDDARRRVDRSLDQQRSATEPSVRERRRETRQSPPPLPSRDNASRNAPSRADIDRQRTRPERQLRSLPETAERERRGVERSAPPRDTRQRVTRDEAVRQQPSSRQAPPPPASTARGERRRPAAEPRSGESGSSVRREQRSAPSRSDFSANRTRRESYAAQRTREQSTSPPAVREQRSAPPRSDFSANRPRRESHEAPPARQQSTSPPVVRSAPRTDSGGSMRAPRVERSAPSRAMRGDSMSRSGSFRMPRAESRSSSRGGSFGGMGSMRGERHGAGGRR